MTPPRSAQEDVGMRWLKGLLLVCVVVVTYAACSSVESIKAPDQTGKIDDVFAVINPGASFTSFGNAVKDGQAKKSAAAGVQAEIIVPTRLELESDLRNQAARPSAGSLVHMT